MTPAPADVEAYLYRHIPLSEAMGLRVREAGPDRVVLAAPLGPNVNHQSTMFGGSESAALILSAWTLLHVRLGARGFRGRLVIQRNDVEYLAPATGDALVTCDAPGPAAWAGFDALLDRRGRGRMSLAATLTCGDVVAAQFEGVYVAIREG